MARSCDRTPPFNIRGQLPEPLPPALLGERRVETVELVFGPGGGFAGFRRTFTAEPVTKEKRKS